MSPQEKTTQSNQHQTHFAEFDDQVLQKTFEDFYATNEEEKKSSIWNFSTIAGLGILGASLLFILQSLLNFFLPGLTGGALNIIGPEELSVLPVIGGGLATITGLGWFRRRKQKKLERAQKKAMRKAMKESSNFSEKAPKNSFNFSYSEKGTNASRPSSIYDESQKAQKSSSQYSASSSYEPYAISKNNRLFKSRREKVVSGVLGGIAKYVGINPALLRLLFVIGFFMSGGIPLLLAYFAFSLILPKEPLIMLED